MKPLYWLAAGVGLYALVRVFGPDVMESIHDGGLRLMAMAVFIALFGIALGFVLISQKHPPRE